MVLITQLTNTGIQLGVAPTVAGFDVTTLETHESRSEQYLRTIEDVVIDAGGWEKIAAWYTRIDAESFTSIRGLVTLVNSLAPLHQVNVFVFTSQLDDAKKVILPIVPSYSSEPNITKRT